MAWTFKHAVYRMAKAAGLFALARRLTRRRARILAYHGFALGDEAQFRSKLFITAATFERRLALLQRQGYRVIGLDEAVSSLAGDRLPSAAVVITIDDGYASTLSVAGPLLKRHGFPATVYLTTYHMVKQTPVFDLALAYMVWKSALPGARLHWPDAQSMLSLDLKDGAARSRSAATLVALGKAMPSEDERLEFSAAVGRALAVDHAAVVRAGAFRLMSMDEARQLPQWGLDVGLHTHRHQFPADNEAVCRSELAQNRELIAQELGLRPRHFCYPSGEYSAAQWPWLADMGLASATTCDTGLARPGDPPFGLKRFLDGESVSELEFEAEISGFSELLRAALQVDRRAAASQGGGR